MNSCADDESSDADTKTSNEYKAKLRSRKKRKFERDSSRTLTSGNNSDASQAELLVKTNAGRVGEEKDISKKQLPKTQENETDDSTSISSDESESKSTPVHASASAPSATSSGSSDESSTRQQIAKDRALKKRKARDESSSDSSSDSSSNSGSDSDSDSEMDEDPPVDTKPGIGLNKGNSHNTEVQVTKKLRTSESGAAVSTATIKKDGAESAGCGNGNNRKTLRKSNTPFRRFDPDKVSVDAVRDNRYEAKVCTCIILL